MKTLTRISAGESFFASFTTALAIAIHHSLYRPAAAGKAAPTP